MTEEQKWESLAIAITAEAILWAAKAAETPETEERDRGKKDFMDGIWQTANVLGDNQRATIEKITGKRN